MSLSGRCAGGGKEVAESKQEQTSQHQRAACPVLGSGFVPLDGGSEGVG
jgi:hypothetical protein